MICILLPKSVLWAAPRDQLHTSGQFACSKGNDKHCLGFFHYSHPNWSENYPPTFVIVSGFAWSCIPKVYSVCLHFLNRIINLNGKTIKASAQLSHQQILFLARITWDIAFLGTVNNAQLLLQWHYTTRRGKWSLPHCFTCSQLVGKNHVWFFFYCSWIKLREHLFNDYDLRKNLSNSSQHVRK